MLPTLPPVPTAFFRTKWDSDPFSRCSYSFVAAGSTPEARDVLCTPDHDGRLWLAGEHTSRERPGTVQGAYESGVRVAKAVAEALTSSLSVSAA